MEDAVPKPIPSQCLIIFFSGYLGQSVLELKSAQYTMCSNRLNSLPNQKCMWKKYCKNAEKVLQKYGNVSNNNDNIRYIANIIGLNH